MGEDFLNKRELLKIIFLTSVICLWLHWLWSRRNLYRFAMKFPGTFGYPLIGSMLTLKHFIYVMQAVSGFIETFKEYTFCVWIGIHPTIFTVDPEFIAQVLSSSELLNKAKSIYKPLNKAFEGGIISSEVPEWNHNRKMINPSFNHKVLLSFMPIFNKGKHLAISIMDAMVDNEEHKLADMLQRLTLGISVETTMGKHMTPGDQVSEEITEDYRYCMKKIVSQIMLSSLNLEKFMFLYIKFNIVKKRIHDFVFKLVNVKINNLSGKNAHSSEHKEDSFVSITKAPNIFIDQAIKIYQRGQLSFNDIIAESNTIVAASFETTANGVFSALVMLAMHTDIQDRLFEEIQSVFPKKDFEMEFEHIQHLPYFDMVINETLRLAPSIPIIARQVVKDTQISEDIILPKGLQIVISIFNLHRRTDIWGPNANKFNPDNFLAENLAEKHAYAYIPFSKGIRNCIGWRYAIFAMKVILAGIIRNYKLTTSMKYDDLQFINNIALKYSNEPLFKIYRRS